MADLPEFLFVVHSEFDVDHLTEHGLDGPYGGDLLLYATLEEAESFHGNDQIGCLVMVHVERMASDGFSFEEVIPGVWRSPAIPPKYLWISERHFPGAEPDL